MQQHVGDAGPAVGAEEGDVAAGVLPHGEHEVGDLGGDAGEDGAGDVGASGAAGDAQNGSPRIHIPIGGTKSGEGGHHHHAAAVGDGGRQHVDLRGGGDDPQLVAEPLDGAAAVENAALQRVGGFAVHLPRHGGEQPGAGAHGLVAYVHQGEAAGAVGVFGFAGGEAGLSEQGGLLVAGGSAHGHARQSFQTGDAGLHRAVDHAVGHGRGEHGGGDAENAAELLVPAEAVDVEEHGAAGVGVVGDVDAGETPDEPAFHRAEEDLAPLGAAADAGDVVQDPADLAAGEIGVDQQAGGGADALLQTPVLQLLAQLRRPAALPDDGVIDGLARGLVPEDGGLPLVGHADAGNSPCREPCHGLRRGRPDTASEAARRWVSHISMGSCSTQPDWGKCWGRGCWDRAAM